MNLMGTGAERSGRSRGRLERLARRYLRTRIGRCYEAARHCLSRKRDKSAPSRHVTAGVRDTKKIERALREDTDSEWGCLLRAANAGDALAYQHFLSILTPALRRFARRALARAVAPEADAEDIVQEILLAIHLKRQTWIESAPVAPWVFTIARHKVIDFLRRRGRRIHLPLDDFAETLAAESEEPSLIGADIDRHLDSLSTVQRKVVRSIAVTGASIAETAADLSMSQGAVRVALHRGLAALAAKFSREG